MNIRKTLSLAIAFVMAAALLAACGGENGGDGPGNDRESPAGQELRRYSATRVIDVGTWWDPANSYDSRRTEVPDSEADPIVGQMRLDNMRAIEERYNVTLHLVDLTFAGIQESISTSIMAGSPDVDVYCMDLNFCIPYVIAGYCLPVSQYARAGSDIYTDQTVFTPLNICDLPEDYLIRISPPMDYNAIYMLGYNQDVLDATNQPSPQDLWDEGQWTWETWLGIMKAVTDPGRNIYGWGGTHVQLLDNLLISNSAGIALTDAEGLTSPATLEVLDFIQKMYNEYTVAKPWDPVAEYWDNNDWSNGAGAFFSWVPWLAQRFGVSRGFGTAEMEECPYTIRTVRWPVGPNAGKDSVGGANLKGNVYMIPAGTKDPDVVYDVFFDYTNWYDYDLSLRDEASLWVESYFTDDIRGFEMCREISGKPQLDIWDFLGIKSADGDNFSIIGLLDGTLTPAQLSEQWRLTVQDYINIAYGKR